MARSGTLRVRILGDSGPLEKTLKGVRGKVAGFAKGVAKVGAAGAVAAAGGLAAAVKSTADYGDRVAKTSRQVGLGVETLQEYEYAFGQNGIEAEKTSALLTRFNKRVGEAANGTGTAKDTLEGLGVALRDSSGEMRSQEDILGDAMRALEGLESSQERAAAAADLFGSRNGPELASAIEAGEDGIDTLRERAHDLGIVMDKDTAEASERFNDSLDDLKQGLMGAVRTVGADLIPVLADKVVPTITDKVIPAIRGFIDEVGPKVTSAMQSARSFIERWWPTVVNAFNTVRDVVTDVIGTVKTIIAGVQETLQSNEGRISGWRDTAVSVFQQIRDVVSSAMGAVTTVIEVAVNIITEFWDRFGKHLVDFLVRTVGRIVDTVQGAFQVLKGIFDLIKAVLTGQWGDAWEAIKSILSGAWRVIRNVVAGAWDAVKTLFGAGVAAISQVWSFLWDQAKQLLSNAWDGILGLIRDKVQQVKDTFTSIVDFIRGLPSKIASAARGLFSGITDAFRDAVNTIIRGWNNLSFTIGGRTFDLPGPLGAITVPSMTLDTPDIPYLADGGIVTSPTLAMIGEAGPEAVIPLSRVREQRQPEQSSLPSTLVVVDADGALIGRMRVETDQRIAVHDRRLLSEVAAGAGA